MYSDIVALQTAILKLCNEKNITINKLASLSNLTQSTIDSIMKGKSKNPKIQTLHKIANGFNMDFEEFMLHVTSSADQIGNNAEFKCIDGETYQLSQGKYYKVDEDYVTNVHILKRVKQLRKERKISLYDFCKDTGLDRNFETGPYFGITPFDTLIKLCDYFNVSADYLLGLSDDPTRH